jgi:hypothetical protein
MPPGINNLPVKVSTSDINKSVDIELSAHDTFLEINKTKVLLPQT